MWLAVDKKTAFVSPMQLLKTACLVAFLGAWGCDVGQGASCFQNDECEGSLICCGASHAAMGTRGTCEPEAACMPIIEDAGADASSDAADAGDAAPAG